VALPGGAACAKLTRACLLFITWFIGDLRFELRKGYFFIENAF
jgi:hypothetical protein